MKSRNLLGFPEPLFEGAFLMGRDAQLAKHPQNNRILLYFRKWYYTFHPGILQFSFVWLRGANHISILKVVQKHKLRTNTCCSLVFLGLPIILRSVNDLFIVSSPTLLIQLICVGTASETWYLSSQFYGFWSTGDPPSGKNRPESVFSDQIRVASSG